MALRKDFPSLADIFPSDFIAEQMHRSSLLIHMPMPPDYLPESQACTEHVIPGMYSREELERSAAFNRKRDAERAMLKVND